MPYTAPTTPTVSAFGTGVATSTGTIVLAAGANITLNTGASSITIVGPAPGAGGTSWSLSRLEMCPMWMAGISNNTLQKVNTVTGTAGFGSSLFLHRVMIPAPMNLTEVDAMMGMAFNATSDGAGTMSRSMAIYSFGNSSSLATVCSASASSAWTTGTVTAGASTSITQFQAGWGAIGAVGAILIQPMTFAATSLPPGEYVVGQLFDFAQLSSSWTVRLHAPLLTTINSAYTQWNALAASAFTGSTSTALTAWTAAPSAMAFAGVGSTAGFSTTNVSTFTAGSQVIKATATAASTASLLLNAGTGAVGLLSSAGLSAGSMINGSQVLSGANATAANFQYFGTGDKSSVYYGPFIYGMSSTGGIPASVAVNNIISATANRPSPWFALIGS